MSGGSGCQVSDYCDVCDGRGRPRLRESCEFSLEGMSASCERSGDICSPVGERETYCLRSCVGQGSANLGPAIAVYRFGEQGDFVYESGECAALTECTRDAECPSGVFVMNGLNAARVVWMILCSDGLIVRAMMCAALYCNADCTSRRCCL